MSHASGAVPAKPPAKDSGSERDSSLIVQEQYIKLKEDMEGMEREKITGHRVSRKTQQPVENLDRDVESNSKPRNDFHCKRVSARKS